jgi:hypothetical protein
MKSIASDAIGTITLNMPKVSNIVDLKFSLGDGRLLISRWVGSIKDVVLLRVLLSFTSMVKEINKRMRSVENYYIV